MHYSTLKIEERHSNWILFFDTQKGFGLLIPSLLITNKLLGINSHWKIVKKLVLLVGVDFVKTLKRNILIENNASQS